MASTEIREGGVEWLSLFEHVNDAVTNTQAGTATSQDAKSPAKNAMPQRARSAGIVAVAEAENDATMPLVDFLGEHLSRLDPCRFIQVPAHKEIQQYEMVRL